MNKLKVVFCLCLWKMMLLYWINWIFMAPFKPVYTTIWMLFVVKISNKYKSISDTQFIVKTYWKSNFIQSWITFWVTTLWGGCGHISNINLNIKSCKSVFPSWKNNKLPLFIWSPMRCNGILDFQCDCWFYYNRHPIIKGHFSVL